MDIVSFPATASVKARRCRPMAVKNPSANSKRRVAPARAAAFDILTRVAREDAYASELLHSERHAGLSSADHGLATELVMGVLRWQSALDEKIAQASSQRMGKLDLEVLIALRLGVYQLLWLDRIPGHAAIYESVELVKRARKRSAVPFANAVLRKMSGTPRPEDPQGAADSSTLAAAFAHPEWLVERWCANYGLPVATRMCDYDQKPPAAALRLRDPDADQELNQAGVVLSPGALLASARRVESGDVTGSSPFKQGRISIQDEGSQLIAALVGAGEQILDCCCAPGGKTAILADKNPSSRIVAVELHPHRARLTRKLVPQKNVHVISADSRTLPFFNAFDRVLVDVPCSGTGTLARNPEIKWRLQFEDLKDLQSRQVAILSAAMRQVRSGGRLVYSSCSLEPEENEEVVQRALLDNRGFQLMEMREELETLRSTGEFVWGDLESLVAGKYLRTLPGIHPCEGFFAAILRRCD
jgi:16S rRNA (cytosine967-C5)-methyltransferase